jgi:CRISPR-associated protein Cas5 subtype I-A
MKAYLVTMRTHWGYSIRNYFASKATDTYIVPPLNTVIGALGMAYSARRGFHVENLKDGSSSKKFIDKIKYVAFSFDYKPIKFTTMIRFSTSIYWVTTHDIQRGIPVSNLFAPIQLGVNSYFNGVIRMLILTHLDKGDLYSITRLGSKESIVSVKAVEEVNEIKRVKGKVNNVTFSFYKKLAKTIIGSFFIDIVPSFSEAYFNFLPPSRSQTINTEMVYVPNPVVSLEPSEEICVFETNFGNAIAPGEICE